MKFSIALPAYRPDFLKEAVASVIAQTFSDWELVIVDDCSPADLHSIVAPYLSDSRVRYYRNEHNIGALNLVDNWNRCLELCRGEYIICIGDDDRFLPDCILDLYGLTTRHPNYGVYHIRTQIIDGTGAVIETLEPRPEIESSLEFLLARWKGRSQFIGDFCFNAIRLRNVGGFYKLPYAWGSDDITEYIVSKGNGKELPDGIVNSNIPGFQYRSHSGSISSGHQYRIKQEAMLQWEEWILSELSNRKPSNVKESRLIGELQHLSRQYFKDLSLNYVRQDAAANGLHFKYWLRKCNRIGLSAKEVAVQSIKGYITKR